MTSRVLVVCNDASDPPARLGEWLSTAGLELDVRDAWADGALPTDLSGYAGLVVLGGGHGAHDDAVAPWLADVKALLRSAVAAELPTLAICLGAQLLAVTMGGRVERGAAGPELGAQLIAKRAVSAIDPLFGPLAITPDVFQWHHDVITALPPGAVLLASSPVYEVQAFRLGRLAWAVQFHPEATVEMLNGWAVSDAVASEYDLDRILAHAASVDADVADAWGPVIERFAGVVVDPAAVRPLRGPAVASAAPVDDKAAIRAALAQEMQSSQLPPGPMGLPTPAPYGQPGRLRPGDGTDAPRGPRPDDT